MDKLNCCSKCGNKYALGPYPYSNFPDTPDWRIMCDICKHTEYGFSEEEVIENWNKIC